MVTSPNEWKILEWDYKTQTNKYSNVLGDHYDLRKRPYMSEIFSNDTIKRRPYFSRKNLDTIKLAVTGT